MTTEIALVLVAVVTGGFATVNALIVRSGQRRLEVKTGAVLDVAAAQAQQTEQVLKKTDEQLVKADEQLVKTSEVHTLVNNRSEKQELKIEEQGKTITGLTATVTGLVTEVGLLRKLLAQSPSKEAP